MGTGAGLIIAIGAQNAFVMNQGIRKEFVLMVPLVCALCDAVLITAGVAGLGVLIEASPLLLKAASWGGGAFLLWYGLKSFRSAFFRREGMNAEGEGGRSRRQVLLMTLAITLLNPHVYLDTVVLLGSIGSSFPGSERLLFALGAVSASFLWFFVLSLGALRLAPLFRRPGTWIVLDLLIGLVMWRIAWGLISPFLFAGV
jgi:L-lysine exporter family protein LysE/ArgO